MIENKFDFKSYLEIKMNEVDFDLTELQLTQFENYYILLLEWNEKINLTAITDPKEVAVKHFVDSALLLKQFEISKNSSLIDVGTGAGFPSVPIKIIRPDLQITLLDSLNKRLNFLKIIGERLNLEFTYVHMRAEDAGLDVNLREKYDIATARAVARMSVLCEYCVPLVKNGGFFLAMKGPSLNDELDDAKNAMKLLSCELENSITYNLSDDENSQRSIAIIKKIANTSIKYPRKGKKLSKNPL